MEDKINEIVTTWYSGNLLDTFVPMNINLDNSVQIIDKSELAFELHAPVSGSTRIVTADILSDPEKMGLIRILIPIHTVDKFISNHEMLRYHMAIFINASLSALTKQMGNLQGRDVRLTLPNGKIFRLCENIHAFEIRFAVLN